MPIVIADNEQRSTMSPSDVSYDYDYPEEMNLKPGSELHTRIINEVMNRARDSYNVMSARHPSWREIDEMTTAYIPADVKEKEVIAKDSRKPISIVVPQTYAALEVLLTYMTAALLEPPLFRYEGRGPEDVLGAILLEKVIDQQCYYTRAAMALHTLFRDGFCYGISGASPVWLVENGWTTVGRTNEMDIFNQLLGLTPTKEKIAVNNMIFEGNRIENIDPYLLLLDPNVPVSRVQDSEFVGWISSDSLTGLLKQEQSLDGQMFNAKYLKHLGQRHSILRKSDASGRGIRSGVGDRSWSATGTTNPCDVIYMYIDLIPEDWKLGDSEYPETWLFGVAADQIVVRAQPLNLNHNKKPIVCFSPDYDGYSTVPIAKIEMVAGLQKVLNWLFNSHITNTRKALNDMFVVDPAMINMKDLEDPEPGKLIKLRRSVWGRDISSAIQQLNVNDVTKNNIVDASLVMDLIKAVSGSTDAVSGLRRKTSERVTAEEVRGDRFGGLSRLEKMAKVAGWMALQDLGYMLASQTQQLMSQETYVKATGQWQDVLVQEYGITADQVPVTPFDILVEYDVVCKDGSIPGGNFADIWVQMLPQIQQDPELRQRMDYVRIIKHIMRSLGAKDINQFDRKQPPQQTMQPNVQAQVMPNEQVQNQIQQGNLVPMNGGAEGGAPTYGNPGAF